MNHTFPCRTCISLARCLSKYNPGNYFSIIVLSEMYECPLLNDFISLSDLGSCRLSKAQNIYMGRVSRIRSFFCNKEYLGE